ncbi:MAG: OmpA family protein [Deltaproteobacteria bacterium]|nr:OmpA family protein [Deltaproteobacteria bacterium]
MRALAAAVAALAACVLAWVMADGATAMTNHHEYYPYGWMTPPLYGALRVSDEMMDFDITVEGEETRREEFVLPDQEGRALRLSHNGRVFCYVADHDLVDPWDYQVVDYDGSGAFESKEPPFSEFPLPRWTFIHYPFMYVNDRRLTDLTAVRDPSVDDMIKALTPRPGERRAAYTPEERAALTLARGGSPPPEKWLNEPDIDNSPRLALNILFDFDRDTLTPQAVRTVNTLGRALGSQELRGKTFRLEGHTDSRGTFEYNMDLSQRRANRVQAYLIDNFDIAPALLPTEAFGESRPLPNLDPENGRNRRVEIVNLTDSNYLTARGRPTN